MEEFKVNTRKMDACSEEIGDCEKKLREIREGVSSIRGNLRHKLSAIEGIGQTLMKIEGNLETETSMMSGLGSTLGTIADNYRHTERGIVDFGTGSISGGQLTDLQKDALRFEEMLGDGSEEWVSLGEIRYLGGAKGPGKNAGWIVDWISELDEDTAQIIDDVMRYLEGGGDIGDLWKYIFIESGREIVAEEFDYIPNSIQLPN